MAKEAEVCQECLDRIVESLRPEERFVSGHLLEAQKESILIYGPAGTQGTEIILKVKDEVPS